MSDGARHPGFILKLARLAIRALLIFVPIVCLLGEGLSGALGEVDDVRGPLLLIWPLSTLLCYLMSLVWSGRLSVWTISVVVLTDPAWTSFFFVPASIHHPERLWAGAVAIVTWPIWGFWGFDWIARRIKPSDFIERRVQFGAKKPRSPPARG